MTATLPTDHSQLVVNGTITHIDQQFNAIGLNRKTIFSVLLATAHPERLSRIGAIGVPCGLCVANILIRPQTKCASIDVSDLLGPVALHCPKVFVHTIYAIGAQTITGPELIRVALEELRYHLVHFQALFGEPDTH